MKSKILKLSVILFIIITGCSKTILDEQPPSIITAESLFKDIEGFEASLNGLYTTVRREKEKEPSDDGALGDASMLGTDIIGTSNPAGIGNALETWGAAINADHPHFRDVFLWLYQIVNATNTIIERANNPEVVWTGNGKTAEVNKNRVIGEAKAIRAWAYRHLTFLWGDVPLVLIESKGSTIRTDWERTPVKQVREQMRSDLLFAEKYLAVEPSLRGRMSKGAVQTYLAELYLVLNKPDSAIIFSDKVINEPAYKLITARYGVNKTKPGTPFSDMFLDGNSNREEGNTEALWVLQYEKGLPGSSTTSYMKRNVVSRYDQFKIGSVTPLKVTVDRGGRGRARLAMTKFAIDLYGSTDERGSNHILRKYFILQDAATNGLTVGADNLPTGYKYGDTIKLVWNTQFILPDNATLRYRWPYSRKFDYADPLDIQASYTNNDEIYLRAADAYLLKAEGQFKKGDLAGAASTINVIRARSKATPVTGAQVTLDFILDERARELVYEEHRRYTLLRTKKWLERTKLYNPNNPRAANGVLTPRDTIFPIPRSVIDANITKPMSQNPGY